MKTFYTSIYDRFLGLINLIFLAGIAAQTIPYKAGPLGITFFIVQVMTIFPLIFFVFLFLPIKKINNLINRAPLLKQTHKVILQTMASYQKPLRFNLVLTFINQMMILSVLIWWDLPFLNNGMEILHAFAASALGLMLIAVPIAPAGAGVGHIMFETLFKHLGLSNGANIFNVYFFLVLFVNFLGIIPFFLVKNDQKQNSLPKINK
jgi:hypothetical protein